MFGLLKINLTISTHLKTNMAKTIKDIHKPIVKIIDKAKVLIDSETMEIYVKKCFECNKLLTMEEASYGHDCEA